MSSVANVTTKNDTMDKKNKSSGGKRNKSGRHRARRCAVQALYQWDLTEQPVEDIENHFIHEAGLTAVDKTFFHHLVTQVPLHKQELDGRINPHLDDRGMDNIDPVERAILRLATYEMEYDTATPAKVILNEAVELAKTFGSEHGYKFINGVLDKILLELRSSDI